MAPRGEPKLCGITVSALGAELSKTVHSIWPGVHEGVKGNGFRGNTGEYEKGMSRNNIREVRDYSNAVPGIRGFICRSVNGWCSMRKSRGRVRM